MGACLCCLRRRPDHFDEQGPGGGSGCCRRCRHFCCFRSCCGMYDALFQTSEEQDIATSAHNASLSQSTGLLDGTSTESSLPIAYSVSAERRHVRPFGDLSRPEKIAANLLHNRSLETHQRSSGGNCREDEGALIIEQAKGTEYSGDKKSTDDSSKFQPSKKNGKVDSLTSLLDDEDICPTCLEGYHVVLKMCRWQVITMKTQRSTPSVAIISILHVFLNGWKEAATALSVTRRWYLMRILRSRSEQDDPDSLHVSGKSFILYANCRTLFCTRVCPSGKIEEKPISLIVYSVHQEW